MTPLEFERWRDFSGRMALHGWPDSTEARKQKIAAQVESFLDHMENLADTIEDCRRQY